MKNNIIITISIILLISVAYNIYFTINFRNEATSLLYKIYSLSTSRDSAYSNQVDNHNLTPTPPGGIANMSLDQRPLMKWRGVIKKERIPEDLQLGDYWYQFYFTTPFLNEYSAVGIPNYVEKLEIVGIKEDINFRNIKLDDFLSKEVEVAGYMGWGYAESNIIEPIAIVGLK